MSDQFVAEIRIFSCDFPPTGWAQCNGQLLPISQNTALFSLLGTTYGGDGKTTFGLPNLQGSAPMFWGQGAGLPDYIIGETGGESGVTLLTTEIPQHTHTLQEGSDNADLKAPSPTRVLARSTNGYLYQSTVANMQPMAFQAVSFQGNNQSHNNMMPSLTLNFCIALQGIYPPRG